MTVQEFCNVPMLILQLITIEGEKRKKREAVEQDNMERMELEKNASEALLGDEMEEPPNMDSVTKNWKGAAIQSLAEKEEAAKAEETPGPPTKQLEFEESIYCLAFLAMKTDIKVQWGLTTHI